MRTQSENLYVIEAEAVLTPLEPANEASTEVESDEPEGVDELLMSLSAEELGAFSGGAR